MKKLVAGAVCLIIIGALAIYFINSEDPGLLEGEEIASKVDVQKSDLEESQKKKDHRITNKRILKVKDNETRVAKKEGDNKKLPESDVFVGEEGESSISGEDLDRMEEYFLKTESEWTQSMQNLILDELNLGQEVLREYQALKEGFERDKMDTFEEYHQFMQEKHGDNYTYIPSKDEEEFSSKINKEYLDRIRKLLGAENYNRYLQLRDSFNDKLKKDMDPEIGVMLMEM